MSLNNSTKKHDKILLLKKPRVFAALSAPRARPRAACSRGSSVPLASFSSQEEGWGCERLSPPPTMLGALRKSPFEAHWPHFLSWACTWETLPAPSRNPEQGKAIRQPLCPPCPLARSPPVHSLVVPSTQGGDKIKCALEKTTSNAHHLHHASHKAEKKENSGPALRRRAQTPSGWWWRDCGSDWWTAG